jgi:hypothetical protein
MDLGGTRLDLPFGIDEPVELPTGRTPIGELDTAKLNDAVALLDP